MKQRRNRARVEALVKPSQVDNWPGWLQHLLALALLGVVLGAVFPEITWQGEVFRAPDYQAPAYFAAAGDRLRANDGAYPLWNPYIFLGMPSFGSLMYTPHVFPLSDLLRALGSLPGFPPLGWLLFFFMAAGYGVFLVLWSLGTGFWPACLGGVAYMLTPHLVSMGIFGHGSKLGAVAFLPYLVWAALRLRNSSRRLLWTGVLGILIGMQLLRGHPQIAYYGLLMLGTMVLVEVAAAWRTRDAAISGYLAGMAAAVGLGFALGAVLLLPVRAYAPESVRGAGEGGGAVWEYATQWSLAPSELMTFGMPSAQGFGESTYVGSMPFTNFPNYLGQATLWFALAAGLFLRGRTLWLFATLALLSLLTSFGKEFPILYRPLYDWLPHFNKFRVPAMILVLFQLALALLAGLGMAALWKKQPKTLSWRRPPQPGAPRGWCIAAGVVALLFVLAGWPWSNALATRVASSSRLPSEYRAQYAEVARNLVRRDTRGVAFFLLGTASVVWLTRRRRLPGDVGAALAVGLLVFDLAAVDRRMVQPQHIWPEQQTRVGTRQFLEVQDSEMAEALRALHPKQLEPVRVLPFPPLFQSNHWMGHGVASVGGYFPAKLERFQRLAQDQQKLFRLREAHALGVQYLVSAEPLPLGREPVYSGPEGFAYAHPLPPERARVVGRWQLTSADSCVDALRASSFDVVNDVLLESAPSGVDSSATGTARIVRFLANRIEVQVQASAPALLLLREAYHSDWRATVNGTSTPVLAADCVLRAVQVPAGDSQVVFTFQDPALRAGLSVSLGAVLVLLGLVLVGTFRGRGLGSQTAGGQPG